MSYYFLNKNKSYFFKQNGVQANSDSISVCVWEWRCIFKTAARNHVTVKAKKTRFSISMKVAL